MSDGELAGDFESPPEPPATALSQHTRRTPVQSLSSERTLVVTAITVLGLAIRLYQLGNIPGEIWGDVIVHHFLAAQVMNGQFYLDYRFGGDGPMFSYIAAGLGLVLGLSFATLKLATVLVGTALIVAVYFLATELFEKPQIGYLASFFTAVSFWSITFSRQAKPYILVPLFAALAVTFVLRRQQILAGMALGLGMYTQAAFWGLPVAFVAAPISLLVGIVVAIPVIYNFAHNPSSVLGSSSYIGSKLHQHLTLPEIALRLLQNIWKQALSYNIHGDTVFRHNIPGHPHLDQISGILFLLGIGLIVWRIVQNRDRRLLLWFLVPFLLVQSAAVLDLTPANTPAMGRMVGVVPFVFSAIGYAIYWSAQRSVEWLQPRFSQAEIPIGGAVAVVLIAIFAINFYNYFEVYPRTLPNGNTPFGRIIARQIDATPARTESIVIGCCWGDWGQPEPQSVPLTVTKPQVVATVDTVAQGKTWVSGLPRGTRIRLFADPRLEGQLTRGSLPLAHVRQFMLRRNGWDVAWVVTGARA